MRSQTFIVLAVFSACWIGPIVNGSEIYFEDGNTHVINYSTDSYVYIDRNKPGLGTQLEIVQGAVLKHAFTAMEDSRVSVKSGSVLGNAWAWDRSCVSVQSGANIANIDAEDNSKINIYGGIISDSLNSHLDSEISIYGGQIYSLYLWQRSIASITGGTFGYAIDAKDDSQMTINSVNIAYDLTTEGHAKVNFAGGSIGRVLQAWEDSALVVSGGTIQSYIGAGHPTQFWDTSTITIVGSNFAINGIPVAYGSYFASDYSSGWLSGTFASGEVFNNSFYIYDAASIVLTPEPGTILLLGFGAAIASKKAKRKR